MRTVNHRARPRRSCRNRERFFTPLLVEKLEERMLLAEISAAGAAAPWHNPFDPLDVSGDTFVAPNDALMVIDHLNGFGFGPVPPGAANGPPFFDATNDGNVSAVDALDVINGLNAFGADAARLTTDSRDFGYVAIEGVQRTQTYVLHNTSAVPIQLSPLQISGTAAADFSVVQAPSSIIAPGGATSFAIKFDPSGAFMKSATISIPNDSVIGNYSFSVFGNGIQVQGLDGATPPISLRSVLMQPGSIASDPHSSLVFTNSAGYEAEVREIVVTRVRERTTFSFVTPPYFDVASPDTVSGTVTVRLEAAGRRVELGSLSISDPPQTDAPPGTLVDDLFTHLVALIDLELTNYATIQRTGVIDVSSGVTLLDELRAQLVAIQVELARLRTGEVSELNLGQLDGVNVILNAGSLTTIDRHLAAIAASSGIASSGSLMLGENLAALVSAAVPPPNPTPNQTALVKMFERIQTMIPSEAPGVIKRIGSAAGATAALALLFGPPGLPVAAVAGSVATAAPLLALGVLALQRGFIGCMLDKTADQAACTNTRVAVTNAAIETAIDSTIGKITERFGVKFKPTAIGRQFTKFDAIKNGYEAIADEQDGLASKLTNAFTPIHEALYPPPLPAADISADISPSEGNSGNTPAILHVTLSFPTNVAVTIDYATQDGTATTIADADYASTIGTLVFAPGDTDEEISIPIVGDKRREPNQTFFVNLFNAPKAILGRKQATVTIVNDDNAGAQITESSGTTNVAEGGATDTYTLVLTSEPTAAVTVTPNPGSQVRVSPTSVTFSTTNWNTPKTVTVTAVNDTVIEGNHTGTITHSATSSDADYNGAAIGSVVANIADNDKVGPGQVFVTVVGNGFVVDNKGQIDTRTGDRLATYSQGTFPFLTARAFPDQPPFGVVWNPPVCFSGIESCGLTDSDYANGLALTVTITGPSIQSAFQAGKASGEAEGESRDLDWENLVEGAVGPGAVVMGSGLVSQGSFAGLPSNATAASSGRWLPLKHYATVTGLAQRIQDSGNDIKWLEELESLDKPGERADGRLRTRGRRELSPKAVDMVLANTL